MADENEIILMDQIGAYSTKHKRNDEEVPQLSKERDEGQSKQISPSQDHAQNK